LLGVDILLDSNYNPYLLEMNVNPAIFTDCETLQELLPKMIFEVISVLNNFPFLIDFGFRTLPAL